ncbi:MAG: PAS domain-containing sensor histidine kinase [Campylobacterales bacterium]|nr:PAS domain-containing sensor histidine kinase [Campylobacterales bacterium]
MVDNLHFETILENISDGVVVFDDEWAVYANKKAFKLLKLEEIIGKEFQELFIQEDGRILGLHNKKIRSKLILQEKQKILIFSKLKKKLKKKKQALKIGKKTVEIEKIKAINSLVTMLMHHWRQPLNIISLTSHDILETYEFEEIDQDYLDEKIGAIDRAVQQLSRTITDFSKFTNEEFGREKFDLLVSLKEVENGIYSSFAQREIEINFYYYGEEESGNWVCGNHSIFFQGISRIFENGIEAIEKRREKEGEKYRGKIVITVVNKIDNIRILISNNGENLDSKDFKKIFEPYYSTKEIKDNVGLGLYFAKSIFEYIMDGKIYCEESSEGAKFAIEIKKLEEDE